MNGVVICRGYSFDSTVRRFWSGRRWVVDPSDAMLYPGPRDWQREYHKLCAQNGTAMEIVGVHNYRPGRRDRHHPEGAVSKPDLDNLRRVIERGVLDAAKDAGITRAVVDVVVRAMPDGSEGAQLGVLVISLTEAQYDELKAMKAEEDRVERAKRASGN